ncbi:MAG: hypothetical protein F4Z08_02705, partial [Chloroflexi bacterium]|nr:hypothetical protein [Chloroflexota bacterium]
MVSITEIQKAILDLPETQYAELRKWLSELDWERWDKQIEADSEAGRLDSLLDEALNGGVRPPSRSAGEGGGEGPAASSTARLTQQTPLTLT